MEKVFEYAVNHLESRIKFKETALASGRKVPKDQVDEYIKDLNELKEELKRVQTLQNIFKK